ncbi:MAG TPA: phosphatidate cytidylyltransferase, partial [Desulfosarcina sp.]|nr:phosphatidate cytidylyltransferase [Desulfosarcina sp.]
MHLKRWITGIVAVPIIYLLVAAGGWIFFVLIAAVSLVTLWEYYRAVFPKADRGAERAIPLIGLILAPLAVWTVYLGRTDILLLLLAVDLILAAGMTLPLFKADPQAPHQVAKQVLGLVY